MSEVSRGTTLRRPWVFWVGALVVVVLLAYAVVARMSRSRPGFELPSFASQVSMDAFDTLAVQSQGRLKSYRSFATDIVSFISGSHVEDPGFYYMDLMLRPEAYEDVAIIYVKSKPLRQRLVPALERDGMAYEEARAFLERGYIAPRWLERGPATLETLDRLRTDAIGAAKHVQALESALQLRSPQNLASNLLMIPPSDGSATSPWAPLALLAEADIVPDERARVTLGGSWDRLVIAWRAQDAQIVHDELETLAGIRDSLAGALYPSVERLGWESWYYASGHMTWVWLVYMLALILLLLSIVYRWRGAYLGGVGVFAIALALHTLSIGLRWYVAGRWPNSNMFEAVTTSVWFGAVFVIPVEWFVRRGPMRGLFYLTSSVASMAALMSAHLMPVSLNPAIGTMMPILHDVWLYIHTNVIIFSYALIAMASVTSILYLLHRAAGGERDYARAGGTGSLLWLPKKQEDAGRGASMPVVLDGVTMVLMELSFVLLWAGIVMGAIWADHSWGRPWGWDPKEVFALNTFLVFVLLIHVRLVTRDKGLWTAWLAVIGCVSMLFNWIVINFIISGLHSYA
ncbi:MAG: cytochrome c biogenesis protein CcsA [Phycisphaerales bacterium JB043]